MLEIEVGTISKELQEWASKNKSNTSSEKIATDIRKLPIKRTVILGSRTYELSVARQVMIDGNVLLVKERFYQDRLAWKLHEWLYKLQEYALQPPTEIALREDIGNVEVKVHRRHLPRKFSDWDNEQYRWIYPFEDKVEFTDYHQFFPGFIKSKQMSGYKFESGPDSIRFLLRIIERGICQSDLYPRYIITKLS